MCKTTKSKSTKQVAPKGAHNFAAASKKYKVAGDRITPEGYRRGTEVEFDDVRLPAALLTALYGPRFQHNTKYIVISVFQTSANQKSFVEVTVRDLDGDCYGYIAAHHLKAFGTTSQPLFGDDPALRPIGLLRCNPDARIQDDDDGEGAYSYAVTENCLVINTLRADTAAQAHDKAIKAFGPNVGVTLRVFEFGVYKEDSPVFCTVSASNAEDALAYAKSRYGSDVLVQQTPETID
jgi:hypothetical protein